MKKLKLITSIIALLIFFCSCLQNDQNNTKKQKTEDVFKKEFNPQEYLLKGKEMAQATGKVLAKQLVSAIKANGTHNALEFCNIEAIPLTDSMSTHLSAKIKRVSDKYRNQKNAANEQELDYISKAKTEIEKTGKALPVVFEKENSILGYYPIMTNALCMQCHGKFGVEIDKETQKAIQANYPKDLAIDYSINELRGIWVVEMEK